MIFGEQVMKQILSLMIFTLILCFSAFAQTSNLQCPQISITEPSQPSKPFEIMIFKVNIVNADKYKISYEWVIDSGEIIEGQGTNVISIKSEKETVTATVEIQGLPENCQNRVTGTSLISCP